MAEVLIYSAGTQVALNATSRNLRGFALASQSSGGQHVFDHLVSSVSDCPVMAWVASMLSAGAWVVCHAALRFLTGYALALQESAGSVKHVLFCN